MAVSQFDKAQAFQRASRRSGRLRHPEPVGHRVGARAGGVRLQGAGDVQRGVGVRARPEGRRADARPGARSRAADRRRDVAAGFRGSRAWLRRRAGDRRRDDSSGGGGGPRRLHDRGHDRRSRASAVRRRPGGRANRGGCRGRAGSPLPVHAHRASAQPDVRQREPRRARSAGFRRSSRPARTSSSRQGFLISRRCGRCAAR